MITATFTYDQEHSAEHYGTLTERVRDAQKLSKRLAEASHKRERKGKR